MRYSVFYDEISSPMNARHLPDLAAFAAVARHRSFARAAAEMGLSRSALSHAVRGLEARLGVRLLNRTTRSVAPTPAGDRILAELSPALEMIGRALETANAYRDKPTGRLRLNVPRLGALVVIAPMLAGFLTACPDVQLELSVDDATLDIVSAGFDAGIRFGERLAADMIAVPVGLPIGFAVVAAPTYLASRSRPVTPEDLATHACIRQRFRASGREFAWEFEKNGRALTIEVDGPLTVDAPELILLAALEGIGLAYLPTAYVEQHVAAGRLAYVLQSWLPPAERLYLYYPSRRHPSDALRVFAGWLTQQSPSAKAPRRSSKRK